MAGTGISIRSYDQATRATGAGFGWWRRLGYAFGNAGLMIGLSPIALMLLFYLTEVVGLRAGQAGMVIALPKMWDALLGPGIGGWVERLAAGMKRRTPIALISGAGFLAALILIFSLPQLQSALSIQITVIALLILLSVTETAFTVSQFALATELSANENELSGLLSLSGGVGQAFLVAGAVMAPVLVSWSGGGRSGYSLMAVQVAAIAAIAIGVFVATTARVPVRQLPPAKAMVSIRASIRITASNRAFHFLMTGVLCLSAASAFIGSVLPFAARYVLENGQHGLPMLLAASGAGAVGGMSLAPWLVRRFGAGQSVRACTLAIAVMLSALFPASYGPAWMNWIAIGGVGLAAGAATILLQTIALELIEHEVGIATGFYLGIMVAGFKLGASMGSLMAGGMLDLIDFAPGGGHQSALTLAGLRIGYTLVPLIPIAIGYQFLRRVTLSPSCGGAAGRPRG